MRKTSLLAVAVLAISAPAFAQLTPMSTGDHPPVTKQYELRDGTTLYVFADGKMSMENRFGNAVSMHEGQTMETKDGQKIVMKGNEIWRVEQHKVVSP